MHAAYAGDLPGLRSLTPSRPPPVRNRRLFILIIALVLAGIALRALHLVAG